MSWLDTFSDDEQQTVEELQNKGITGKPIEQKKDVGLFAGAADSPIRGAGVGFIKVADTLARPLDYAGDAVSYAYDTATSKDPLPSFNDYRANAVKQRDDLVLKGIEALEDHENTGLIGNIGVGLGDYIWRGFAGGALGGLPGAASVTGASTGTYQYNKLTHEGVDNYTALQVAGVNAVGDAAATALPLSYGFKGVGGVVKDGVLSVGGATGLLAGMQFTSSEVLKDAGYNKEATQFEVTKESVLTDLVLNSLLFGAARGVAHRNARLSQEVEAEITQVSENPDARSDVINEALVRNEIDFESTLTPVHTADPIQQNKHYQNLDVAAEQIKTGQPVQVPHQVQGNPKSKAFNYESSALPTNAKLIASQASKDGVDPSVALTIAQMESNFSHTAQPPIGKDGKRLSSAYGLFQPLEKTWKNLGGGDKNNIEEQIRIGLKHIKQANSYIKQNLGREPVAHEQYLGHLLGPSGAVHVLKADPNAKLIDIVRQYDKRNADAIVNNNGMSGMTVGQAIDKWSKKWNTVSSRYNSESITTAYGMDGSSYDLSYEIRDLNDLITSNDALYGVNPHYPAELQPRDRTREASRQQIENMAADLKPELLGESHKLSDGSPITGLDNVVESGNGRVLGIGKAYADGKADAYRQFVNDFANTRGWDISGINNPVLVRTRLSEVDRPAFTRLANESDVAQMSASERAKSDVNRLPDASLLRLNSDGNINLEGSMDYVRSFVDQLPQSERATAITGEGRLSQDGKNRIETALVSQAYGDSNLVARLSENIGEEGKTVLNALLRSAPQLAQLADLVKQGGRHTNTIAKDLAAAAQKLSDLKANGLRVDDYLNQGQLIDDGLSTGAKDFLQVFDKNNRSSKAITDYIKSKIDVVDAMGDPRQGSLFGDTPDDIAFMNVVNENPNQMVAIKRVSDEGVEVETEVPLHQLVSELEMEAKQAELDNTATQAAISCALQFGE
ncbi:transglycosylase SLT domain-containing protein [Acinetobacter modestus]|uniref:transglycosylase SLT domain-containing protein n=1 Tax=Acinetobacter modestus TaxID=1776740 RepID=UPI00202FF6C9|nr:transglycosylase SLT domain-containing protein [Acinetobacter modestus]MCM1957920.1 transglycosylase SLT domain-containing protein [Acinetobacter modestus]